MSGKQLRLMMTYPRTLFQVLHIAAVIPCIKYILAILVLSIKTAGRKKKGLLLAPVD